jgi:hypothetical protein
MTDCKHDWHFLPNTDRLQCRRCKAETGPRTYDQRVQDMLHDVTTMGSAWSRGGERIDPMSVYAVPTAQLQGYKLHDSRPNSIRFFSPSDTSTEVLRISKDGIWANPDVPTDEAAKKVLEALDSNIKHMTKQFQDRIDTLHAMYEQACRQRDELMDQQRAQIEAMRGRIQ